jgi:hypothetical protein
MAGSPIEAEIRRRGLSIYDTLATSDPAFYQFSALEAALRSHLIGLEIGGAIRTRAKLAKMAVCDALGYPTPSSFAKTRPRFPGQNLDVYVQQSNNLQIWNEEVDPSRRYALIRPDSHDIVRDVRVVTGDSLAAYDTTGTLTSKYQAKRRPGSSGSSLISPIDTVTMQRWISHSPPQSARTSDDAPSPGSVLSISQVFERLLLLEGRRIHDPGPTQDRLRGELLQEVTAKALGTERYANTGQWPDLRAQAIEVKLQTSPTIDLGLVLPSSTAAAPSLGPDLRHCDVRYVVVYATPAGTNELLLSDVVVTTGEHFFQEFVQFGGLTVNRKLQLHLPDAFFQS